MGQLFAIKIATIRTYIPEPMTEHAPLILDIAGTG
jgi:hypothetical protein